MDPEEFRKYGKQMVDYVADYWQTMRNRKPTSDYQPGYIWNMIPDHSPEDPEPWDKIFADIDRVVLQGTTHWHHPHFFAYYPTAISYPAIMGDILSSGLATIGFTWNSCPASTELELGVVDWVAKMLKLPDFFLNSDPRPGVGMIQCSASDCTLVALLAARNRLIRNSDTGAFENEKMSKLVAYTSEEAHSSVERAGLLSAVHLRKIPTSENYAMRGDQLEYAIKEDIQRGYIPFFVGVFCLEEVIGNFVIYRVASNLRPPSTAITAKDRKLCDIPFERAFNLELIEVQSYSVNMYPQGDKQIVHLNRVSIVTGVCATLGTTPSCAFDNVSEIGPVCKKYNLFLHIDAAYAGSAFACPEYRYLLNGVEHADSFNFNAHKFMMVNFDCSLMWFKNGKEIEKAFLVDPTYLKHEHQGKVPDLRNLQIPLGRRFRSLKLWFVLRAFGVKGIQEHVRKQCTLAENFADLVKSDCRFEICAPVVLGLVTFRLQESNEKTEQLYKLINDDKRIHLVPSHLREKYILRFSICSTLTKEDDVKFAWNVITELTEKCIN